ncbi:MAG: MBOAT family protein [Clostridia bacterium]|nr:MBOAT family protein [Clostridia bacterium]
MSFTSYGFIAFLVLLFGVYFATPCRFRWVTLLLAGYVFYAFSGLENFIFILATTVSSYIASMVMKGMADREDAYISANKESMDKDAKRAYRAKEKKKRRAVLIVALVFNFGILATLKYSAFAVNTVNGISGLFGATPMRLPSLLLPLGISFYTFGTMGYLIDAYRGRAKVEKNPAKLALFVSFFPSLIQGPISRFSELEPQLVDPKPFSSKVFFFGLQRIIWGFFKKLVIADRILVAMNMLLGSPDSYGGGYVFILIIFYSIQIYADFTGGIDITIGIAEALGIKLAENFKRPFSSKTTKEYWERWHITMGSWFRDYIFYPMSFSRSMMNLSKKAQKRLGKNIGAKIPLYISSIVTWFVTGIWHGAGWNFIVWGLLNCAVILVSDELTPLYRRFHSKFPKLAENKAYLCFMSVRTFLLMGVIRSLDCYRNVGRSFAMWGSMFTSRGWGDMLRGGMFDLGLSLFDYAVIGIGCIVMYTVSKISGDDRVIRDKLYDRPILCASLMTLLTLSVLLLGAYSIGYDASSFIYNQF